LLNKVTETERKREISTSSKTKMKKIQLK